MRILLTICAFVAFLSPVICQPFLGYVVEEMVGAWGYTEVAFWRGDNLFFIDSYLQNLCSCHTTSRLITCVHIGLGHLSFAVPVKGETHEFVVGCGNNIILIEWDNSVNAQYPLYTVLNSADDVILGNRVNYATVDHFSRLWIGTTNDQPIEGGDRLGSVYSLDLNKTLVRHIWELDSITGGFVWEPRSELNARVPPFRFYYADTPNKDIILYLFTIRHQALALAKRIVLCNLPAQDVVGSPGRITIDDRGWLWVALIGGGGVYEFDPFEETLRRFIRIPAAKVGACTFGGPHLDILYVSTIGYEYKEPHSPRPYNDKGGHIYAVKGLGVRGLAANEYYVDHSLLPPHILHARRRRARSSRGGGSSRRRRSHGEGSSLA